ncbi:MAG: GntR family transcriptional regulator [Pseudomonadota bacterium]
MSGTTAKIDVILEHIRKNILTGIFAPGQRLVEPDLMQDLGASRGPIREAFRILAGEGLVESIPHKGTNVRRISDQEIRDMAQLRTLIEPLGARLAAMNIVEFRNRSRLAELEAVLASNRDDWPSAYQLNQYFHLTIAAISGNKSLEKVVLQLNFPLPVGHVGHRVQQEHSEAANNEHLEIVQAISKGDADAAESAMSRHLLKGYELLFSKTDF